MLNKLNLFQSCIDAYKGSQNPKNALEIPSQQTHLDEIQSAKEQTPPRTRGVHFVSSFRETTDKNVIANAHPSSSAHIKVPTHKSLTANEQDEHRKHLAVTAYYQSRTAHLGELVHANRYKTFSDSDSDSDNGKVPTFAKLLVRDLPKSISAVDRHENLDGSQLVEPSDDELPFPFDFSPTINRKIV